jgi:ubiquinone/menaquinone biosynthesis C-methylase UbiE
MHDEVTRSPAELYDAYFAPALSEPWGRVVAYAAEIGTGQRVLDVACGTGVLARAAAERAGPEGKVVGIDPNEDMLTVARRRSPGIEWRSGRAESLPFPDASFEAVVSQFGYMFFEDKRAALEEMMRVLRPGGRLAVAVCDALDHSPGYAVFTELLHRLFGEAVAEAFRAPFACGDRSQLLAACIEAGITNAQVTRHDGMVRFASVDSLVSTERACVWTLGGLLDAAQFERLLNESRETLRPFQGADGKVAFIMPALIITASRPQ